MTKAQIIYYTVLYESNACKYGQLSKLTEDLWTLMRKVFLWCVPTEDLSQGRKRKQKRTLNQVRIRFSHFFQTLWSPQNPLKRDSSAAQLLKKWRINELKSSRLTKKNWKFIQMVSMNKDVGDQHHQVVLFPTNCCILAVKITRHLLCYLFISPAKPVSFVGVCSTPFEVLITPE